MFLIMSGVLGDQVNPAESARCLASQWAMLERSPGSGLLRAHDSGDPNPSGSNNGWYGGGLAWFPSISLLGFLPTKRTGGRDSPSGSGSYARAWVSGTGYFCIALVIIFLPSTNIVEFQKFETKKIPASL